MHVFDVSGCKADIIRPGTTLDVWVKSHQSSNLIAVCNASLYNGSTREPIGTIFEDGKLVHNDGNGYGFGVIDDLPVFGSPWTKIYQEYISGYNSPIQNGVYCAPTFRDDYVFGCPNTRIGVGEKNGKICLCTDDNVILKQFADHALASGFTTLVNLDGGGSRFLYYKGQIIYNSIRVPYNALVFYKDELSTKPEAPKESYCPYAEPSKNVFWGCCGESVKWVQYMLNQKGYNLDVDGKFFFETFSAVWNFQKTWTRYPDGIVGPNTRGELKK